MDWNHINIIKKHNLTNGICSIGKYEDYPGLQSNGCRSRLTDYLACFI